MVIHKSAKSAKVFALENIRLYSIILMVMLNACAHADSSAIHLWLSQLACQRICVKHACMHIATIGN